MKKSLIMDSITKYLLEEVEKNIAEKSSHWDAHTKRFQFSNEIGVAGVDGFSARAKKFPGSNLMHKLVQNWVFKTIGIPYKTIWYKIAQNSTSRQGRSLDVCALRHVFTFDFIDKYTDLSKIKNICVIGDGQANFCSLALESEKFNKIISINLPEILLSDLELIKCLNISSEICISVCKSREELLGAMCDRKKRFIMVCARNMSFLEDCGIQFFVNIASFQEMKLETIHEYFKIIQSNKSILYTCNREKKQLIGGEITEFQKYPWGNGRVIVSENCKWHQKFYGFHWRIIPKIQSYDGNHMHRIISYN